MILVLVVATAVFHGPTTYPGQETVVCGRSTRYEDQLCHALSKGREWRYEDAAAAYEEAARYSMPDSPRAAEAYAAAGKMWMAAGRPEHAVSAIDRALSNKGLQPERRAEALRDRTQAATMLGRRVQTSNNRRK